MICGFHYCRDPSVLRNSYSSDFYSVVAIGVLGKVWVIVVAYVWFCNAVERTEVDFVSPAMRFLSWWKPTSWPDLQPGWFPQESV